MLSSRGWPADHPVVSDSTADRMMPEREGAHRSRTDTLPVPWRIAKSVNAFWVSATLLRLTVRDLAVLFLHLLVTVARLGGPGGARSLVAESVLVKQQL